MSPSPNPISDALTFTKILSTNWEESLAGVGLTKSIVGEVVSGKIISITLSSVKFKFPSTSWAYAVKLWLPSLNPA